MLSKLLLKTGDFLASITKQVVLIMLQKYGVRPAASFDQYASSQKKVLQRNVPTYS